MEQIMEHIAHELGKDVVEVKERNLSKEGQKDGPLDLVSPMVRDRTITDHWIV